MNARSLALAAVALLIGIGIGVSLRDDPPETQSPGAPEQTNPSARHSDADDESASTESPAPESPSAESPPAESPPDWAANPPRGGAGAPQVELSRTDSRRREPQYRDDTFGSDEPELPFPQFVDEAGAAADFEHYGDGPVSPGIREAEDRGTTESRPSEDINGRSGAEGCLPPFSSCRRDTDCCGASVCRSRPGTISGSFECTAG